MLYALRQRIALAICPELAAAPFAPETYFEVRVQTNPDGPWLPGWIITGALHWAKPGAFEARSAMRPAAVCGDGFYVAHLAREAVRARRLKLTRVSVETGKVAGDPDPLRSACEEHIRQEVPSGPRSDSLNVDVFDRQGRGSRQEFVDGLDEAHQHDLIHIGLVLNEADRLFERNRHRESLHPTFDAPDGMGSGARAEAFTHRCLPKGGV